MNRCFLLALAMAALTLVSACSAPLNRPAPERRFYALTAKRPDVAAPAPRDKSVLKVRPVQISPAYQGKEMVYRLGEVRFESDYYNAFFVQPASALAQQIEQWLGRSGVFGHVVDSTSQVQDAFLLEGMVNALYGDFRDKAAPKAVLEAQFFLLASVNDSYQVAFSKSYRQEVSFPAGFTDAAGLAEAYNTALAATLAELENDLRAARAAGFK
jgi:cholesterol transport system auxiliary component